MEKIAERDELVTASEAARILRLSRSQVRRLAENGTLPVHLRYPHGIRRFRRSDVEALLARAREGARR